ncbi:hypothetical protein LCL95_15735 [Bacillus timonensis]|nr:hypothetical protein [Bacillus timonensis]
MSKESLINSFMKEVQHSNEESFPIYVDSFTNIWEYEYGSLDDIPSTVDDLIAHRAVELGLID